ncbi:MAG: GyrI-like domain-containing protein [Nocardioides sp.]
MDIRIEHEKGRHLAVARFEADLEAMAEKMGEAFGRVGAALGRAHVPPVGPAMAFYDIRPDGMTVSAGFLVPHPVERDGDVRPLQLPPCEVVRAEHLGPYDDLPATYERIRKAAADHGRDLDETQMWEEYLTGPETPPEQTRTLVSWPLLPEQRDRAWLQE